MEVLWPMDRTVDGGEGQPGPELGPGGSCGVHSVFSLAVLGVFCVGLALP